MANLRYYAVLLAVSGAMVLGGCTVGVNDDYINGGNGNDVYRPAWGNLSQETVERLTQDYMDWYGNFYLYHAAPRLRYLGTYNGFVVFCRVGGGGFALITRITIGGVEFTNAWLGIPIYLWKDGRIYMLVGVWPEIPNVYDKGLLTREDLESIADAWHNRPEAPSWNR